MYLFTRQKNLAIKRWNHETVDATSIYNWEGLSMITFCLRDSVCRRDSKPVVQVFGFSLIWLNISWIFFMDNFNSVIIAECQRTFPLLVSSFRSEVSYLQEKKHYKNTYFAVCNSIDKCRIAEQGGIWYNLVCVLFT